MAPRFFSFKTSAARRRLACSLFFLTGSIRGAEQPAYLASALAHFSAEPPAGWAYQATVNRGAESSVENFDPSRPAGRQWVLVRRDGREPTAAETERYQRYRETNNATAGARATFVRGDLDLGGARLLHEGAEGATIACRFRSDAAEPMLAHLELVLAVCKQPAGIGKATLHLLAPYSPVVGMRMMELEVETTYAGSGGEFAGLPLTAVSRFHGRILWFWSIDEESRVTYSDFRKVNPSAGSPAHP
jgi:hypothetical protein